MVYLPVRRQLQLDTSSVRSRRLAVTIYDPATGTRAAEWETENTGELDYVPPLESDTFMIVDDATLTRDRNQDD
jgi:hypothetical protein